MFSLPIACGQFISPLHCCSISLWNQSSQGEERILSEMGHTPLETLKWIENVLFLFIFLLLIFILMFQCCNNEMKKHCSLRNYLLIKNNIKILKCFLSEISVRHLKVLICKWCIVFFQQQPLKEPEYSNVYQRGARRLQRRAGLVQNKVWQCPNEGDKRARCYLSLTFVEVVP